MIRKAIRLSLAGEEESTHFVQCLNDQALRRPLTYVFQFLGHSGDPYRSTIGNPVYTPDSLFYVKDLLENIQIEVYGAYLVIPYSKDWLRMAAMVDYLSIATQWPEIVPRE